MADNSRRLAGGPWLLKAFMRALGKRSAVPYAIDDVQVVNLGLPPHEDDPDPPETDETQIVTGFVSQDMIYESLIPDGGLDFELGGLYAAFEDDRWTTR